MRKEKEEKKKKDVPEKGKKRNGKCGADWLTAGGRRASERSRERIKEFAPWTIKKNAL